MIIAFVNYAYPVGCVDTEAVVNFHSYAKRNNKLSTLTIWQTIQSSCTEGTTFSSN